MRALGQNPTNKDVTKILGNPSADGKPPLTGCRCQWPSPGPPLTSTLRWLLLGGSPWSNLCFWQIWPTRGSTLTLSCPCWRRSTPFPRAPLTTTLRVCASSTRRATAQSWVLSCALCCPPWVGLKSPSPNIEAEKIACLALAACETDSVILTWIPLGLQERRCPSLRLRPSWLARRTRTAACTMRVRPDFPRVPFVLFLIQTSHMDFPLSSFRQAHHVCVRGQQEECWGDCSSSTGSPTVSRTSTTPCQRPTKERQGLWTRDVEENPSCCILFSFHFKPSSILERPHRLSGVDPTYHSASAPPGACLHLPHGVRNGGEGVTAHQVRVDPSLPTATSFSHDITDPAMPKVLEKGCGQTATYLPISLKSFIYCHSVHYRINFSNLHPIFDPSFVLNFTFRNISPYKSRCTTSWQ